MPLLAIPPFPGAGLPRFATPAATPEAIDIPALLAALAAARVGGCYWGVQAPLPETAYVLDGGTVASAAHLAWTDDADPWHLLAGARGVILAADDPRVILASAAGLPVQIAGTGAEPEPSALARLVKIHLTSWHWHDPFSGARIGIVEAIALARFWRDLVDSNRRIVAALGFAYWKKPAAAPLLWGGQPVNFARALPDLAPGQSVAVWRSRLSAAQARSIARTEPPLFEVEDGFIRSAGLGADCVPPLSLIVDGDGVHFDPTRPSTLERLLQEATFSSDLLMRACRLRRAIVAGGVSKYDGGLATPLPRPGGDRRHVLVPGQVEDDRAVTSGGALASNLDLLQRARVAAGPDAFVIYRPHPDVVAGHRRGHVADADVVGLADRVDVGTPIAALIAMVDELHVNSSLAGFEALLRDKPVTVHGVPFYAGWGLTCDRGPVPTRRSKRRGIDELVAAALLIYPRYLDPVTGLPCPAEVLVKRLTSGLANVTGAGAAVVKARRWQGRVRAGLGRLLQ